MRESFPETCFPALQAEVTPELVRSCPDKIGLLFQVQLLGRSVESVDAGLGLLMDLARELVPHDKGALLWRGEPEAALQVHASVGFAENAPAALLRDVFHAAGPPGRARPLLLDPERSPTDAFELVRRGFAASSLLLMPIYAGGSVAGALVLLRNCLPGFGLGEAHLLRVFTFSFESVLDALLHGGSHTSGYTDALTGLFNRRYFDQQLEREVDRARRSNEQVSLFLAAIDDFPSLRQRYGRAAGEALLHEAACVLGSACRKMDILARFGDESFALILPGAGKPSLASTAERIFRAFPDPFRPEWLQAGTVTCSLSAVSYPEDGASPESLIEACAIGLEVARSMPGRHYYQHRSRGTWEKGEDALDAVRTSIVRGPLLESGKLLEIFGRLCLEAVPADRISIMVRDGEYLALRVAVGFEGREDVVQSVRLPLAGSSVSAWVAQSRTPLLVRGASELEALPLRSEGAYRTDSFFSYPFVEGDDLVGLVHFSNRSDGSPFSERDVELFLPLARVMERYVALFRRFGGAQEAFLREALALLVELREARVRGMERHSEEVARLAEMTARELGYGQEDRERLAVSSRLHDLGNVVLRSGAFSEARELSPSERALAQRHPLLAWKFLKDLPVGPIDRDAILYHHEREDGSGYFGRKGADTPEPAKILGVVDVYQAITSHRPYRAAVSKEEALAYLEGQKGVLFDGRVVDALRAAVRSN